MWTKYSIADDIYTCTVANPKLLFKKESYKDETNKKKNNYTIFINPFKLNWTKNIRGLDDLSWKCFFINDAYET